MSLIRESIPFTTREAWLAERAKDITSTDVAALFGISPYLTRWELWHRKVAGDVEPEELDAERVRWGNRLESAIAAGAAEERGWSVRPLRDYIRLAGLRIGSSFDFVTTHGDDTYQPVALLECKNVDSLAFRDGWIETEYGLEAPAHIELQVQHQMLSSGIRKCYIAALVGGNRLVILERDYDPAVGDAILRECAAFWAGGEPSPDFKRDADLIRRLYSYSGPGPTVDADERMAQLMDEADQFKRMQSVAGDEYEARIAEIRTLIGDAGKVLSTKHSLSRWTVKETPVSYVREAYDVIRITERKSK